MSKPDFLSDPRIAVRPPLLAQGFEWIRKGVGWDLRSVTREQRKRKRRHIGHLGAQVWLRYQVEAATPAELMDRLREHMRPKFEAKGLAECLS